jgi:membrane protease YdiL (CAAX protease family)
MTFEQPPSTERHELDVQAEFRDPLAPSEAPRPSLLTTRIPNFFHFLLLLGLLVLSAVVCEGLVAAFHRHHLQEALANQRLQLYANIGVYAVAGALAAALFPLLWKRSFAEGIAWNRHRVTIAFLPLGLALGFLSQAVSSLLPVPKEMPIDNIARTPGIIWVLTIFGIVVAPLFEELVFRGFLLPAVAIAADYFTLPRTENAERDLAALVRWRHSDRFVTNSLVFASVVTSLAFAAIHAPQLGYAWPAVALLFAVSLVLCYVRIRTQSLAATTVVHACYNASVFLALFVATGGYRHMDRI